MTREQDGFLPAPLPPAIYHLAEAANWSSIQQHGLLSTSALLDLSGLQGSERMLIERQQRTQHVVLANGVLIRDQTPMPPTALEHCLHGMTPSEWYALLNARIFFWLEKDRLNRMLKANRARPQIVMVLDTARLLAAYAEQITLTPFNTGNARRKPALRSRQTFVPYKTWLESRWASEAQALGIHVRPKSHKPAELTIFDRVADVMSFVKQTRYIQQGDLFDSAPADNGQ